MGGSSEIKIEPLKLMAGSVADDDFSIRNLVRTKKVEDGEEYVKNTEKKWYKPWTWFQESGYYRTKYKTVEYIDASQMAQEFFAPINAQIYENGEQAQNHAKKESEKIARMFSKEFERLDSVLKEKLSEMESYATDKEKAQERVRESEKKLDWLKSIKEKVNSILEI